jgi:hypothetical protein
MEQIITPAGSKKLARASGRKQKLSCFLVHGSGHRWRENRRQRGFVVKTNIFDENGIFVQ